MPIQRRSRRGLWWLLVLVVVSAGVAAWPLISDAAAPEISVASVETRFAVVVVADLIEEESYDGTLGTTAADPIRAQRSGTVTAVADPGTPLAEGDVAFSIDNEPVVVLNGELPSYRDMATAEPGSVAGLTNRATGTVTRVAEPGDFVDGGILYWVDEAPVVLLYGELPLYRTIGLPRVGDLTGPDVLQLKEALVGLGYDPDGTVLIHDTYGGSAVDMVERWQEDIGAPIDGAVAIGDVIYVSGPVEVIEFLVEPGDAIGSGQAVAELPDDEEDEILEGTDVLQLEAALVRLGFDAAGALTADGIWDDATEAAVVEWQLSIGADDDGVLNRGDVVFLPAPVRVLEQLASSGSTVNAGTAVVGISSADKLVTMNLPAADQSVVIAGDSVIVELPDGSETPGTVREIASVATVGPNNTTVFVVTIALDDSSVAAGLDEAPVDVLIVSESVLGVQAVPVTALLVLAEGGYAVEVDDGTGGTRLVGVEPAGASRLIHTVRGVGYVARES